MHTVYRRRQTDTEISPAEVFLLARASRVSGAAELIIQPMLLSEQASERLKLKWNGRTVDHAMAVGAYDSEIFETCLSRTLGERSDIRRRLSPS